MTGHVDNVVRRALTGPWIRVLGWVTGLLMIAVGLLSLWTLIVDAPNGIILRYSRHYGYHKLHSDSTWYWIDVILHSGTVIILLVIPLCVVVWFALNPRIRRHRDRP